MVDLTVSIDDLYNVQITQDLVILIHVLEFIAVGILVGLVTLTVDSMSRAKEVMAIPTSVVFVLLAVHALFVIVVRFTLVFVNKEKNIVFRIASVLLVLFITFTLFVGRLHAFLFLAPILLFDLMVYSFANNIIITGQEHPTEAMLQSNNADMVSLCQSLQGYSGRMLNVQAFINRTTATLNQEPEEQCPLSNASVVKLNESKTQLRQKTTPSSKPLMDWKETIAATTSIGGSGIGLVSVDSLLTHINDKYFRVGRSGNKMNVVDAPQNGHVTVEIQGKLFRVVKCEESYDALFDDMNQFTTYWDGIRSGNHTVINLYKLSSAVRNVQVVGGRPFIDLDGLLTEMNTWSKEPNDYAAVCARFAQSSGNAKSVSVARFVAYLQKDLMITKVKPADIALSLQSLHGKPIPKREPKQSPMLDAFDYGSAVKLITTTAPYHRFINCEELVRRLDSLDKNEMIHGTENTFSRLIRGAGHPDTGQPVVNVYNAVVNVVLSGYGSITVKEFIKRSLMFVLHNDDIIDKDYVFQKFYTDKAFLKSWVKQVVEDKKTLIHMTELGYSLQESDDMHGDQMTQTKTFYYTDQGELESLKARFEEETLLQPGIISFNWLRKN